MSTYDTRRAVAGALLMTAVMIAASWLAGPASTRGTGKAQRQILQPPPTPEPLVPTAQPAYRPTMTPRPLPSPASESRAQLPHVPPNSETDADADTRTTSFWQPALSPARARVCVGVPVGEITDYDWGDGLPGWYLNWQTEPDPAEPDGIRFAQMVHDRAASSYEPLLATIATTAPAHPGALWLIGNEPDVVWQDNATPEKYAAAYGILYRAIKDADPTAQVAIAGVSQPTPLRMAYLERVLDAYRQRYGEPMPVDVWNVHAFILREERDSWGVRIPPGMAEDQGILYEIGDHADIAIFKRQIADFRRWMADHGFRDKPLIVSEYGILMPASYGFPLEVVSQFMIDTFDYFLTARDTETGYPADDNRLVQAFCWYSAGDTPDRYPASNLFDPKTRRATPLGEIFKAYVAALR